MADRKAAAELIRQLRRNGHPVTVHGNRAKVWAGKRYAVIPGEHQKVAGRAIANVRTQLRRELGIDI